MRGFLNCEFKDELYCTLSFLNVVLLGYIHFGYNFGHVLAADDIELYRSSLSIGITVSVIYLTYTSLSLLCLCYNVVFSLSSRVFDPLLPFFLLDAICLSFVSITQHDMYIFAVSPKSR